MFKSFNRGGGCLHSRMPLFTDNRGLKSSMSSIYLYAYLYRYVPDYCFIKNKLSVKVYEIVKGKGGGCSGSFFPFILHDFSNQVTTD